MEEELNTIQPEIVEDMPDFEENTAEMPCESEKSVDNQSADTENAILNEENQPGSAEKTAESKDSFNPLQLAFKPLLQKAIAEDELFAKEVKDKESRKEKPKSFSECCDYIMGEFYKYACEHKFDNGAFGFGGCDDEKIVSMIKHYYDEDDIVIKKFNDAKAVVKTTMPTPPAKTAKKTESKPKPVKNVVDITKAIKSATKPEDGKKTKREKKKDNLNAGFVPMDRPETLKDAKKGSKEQAKSVEQMDLFADFFAN